MSELSRMLARYSLTFNLGEGSTITLSVWDARLDTTTVYTVARERGASAAIVLAYADYQAEYGA